MPAPVPADALHMDIAGLASSMSQASLQSSVDFAVAKKSLDTQRAQGQAIVQMLDAAKDIAATSSKGSVQGLDLYA